MKSSIDYVNWPPPGVTSPAQTALAWLLHCGDDIVPIPGMKNRSHLTANIDAVNIQRTEDEIRILDGLASQIVGERYQPKNQAFVDDYLDTDLKAS